MRVVRALYPAGNAEVGVKTPQKAAWRSNTIAEEPEEEDLDGQGARPQALSASACQQVCIPHACLMAAHSLSDAKSRPS